MAWYRKANKIETETTLVLYVPLVSARVQSVVQTDGIRLAHACPGVLEGEERCITAYTELDYASYRHPLSPIAELHVPMTAITQAHTPVHYARVPTRDEWHPVVKEVQFKRDLPADWVRTVHLSSRDYVNQKPQHSEYDPFSDDAKELIKLTLAAERFAGSARMAMEHYVNTHVQNINQEHDRASFYATLPGMDQWVGLRKAQNQKVEQDHAGALAMAAEGIQNLATALRRLRRDHNEDILRPILKSTQTAVAKLAQIDPNDKDSIHIAANIIEALMTAKGTCVDHLCHVTCCYDEKLVRKVAAALIYDKEEAERLKAEAEAAEARYRARTPEEIRAQKEEERIHRPKWI